MLLGEYKNGNYQVSIFSDGTKIRETEGDSFVPDFPESMDLKITNYCERGCAFCHENSSTIGEHGDIMNMKFIDTLRPYTEIAIGGGDPLAHPQLVEFLQKLKDKNIIANITVHQDRFVESEKFIEHLVEERLIHGLGISIHNADCELLTKVSKVNNAVIHVVNGIISTTDFRKMYDRNLKVLILGYKVFRRGKEYYSQQIEDRKAEMYAEMPVAIKHLEVTSFDNLAIEQLDVKRLLSDEQWNEFYMGDDGKYTMYVDAVKREYAKSSVSTYRLPLSDTIKEMFNNVRN